MRVAIIWGLYYEGGYNMGGGSSNMRVAIIWVRVALI